jgi:hypothetical protein
LWMKIVQWNVLFTLLNKGAGQQRKSKQ